eukprot:CAMPEP_0170197096 /NCGR_PEP_ID=MMETSP0040_2-20121228/65528_1 /TAXON_ID=641309 /ORGANISM="Lotharella oceanica, Strain CCMP622" /LENGTH=167 /DNA_ID=CAMNT_0010446703 /DNA_START=276 /DNA_END=776 /DNA_ORIENTATION=+
MSRPRGHTVHVQLDGLVEEFFHFPSLERLERKLYLLQNVAHDENELCSGAAPRDDVLESIPPVRSAVLGVLDENAIHADAEVQVVGKVSQLAHLTHPVNLRAVHRRQFAIAQVPNLCLIHSHTVQPLALVDDAGFQLRQLLRVTRHGTRWNQSANIIEQRSRLGVGD